MILNPSHKITLRGLPPDILDAYVRYKKGTRAIVSWIVQSGPSSHAGARSLSLKELAKLAMSLAGRSKEMSEVIHFHFRETIAARKLLSKYFRGNVDESSEDIDTANHEHFTTSLTDIYKGLCQCYNKSEQKCNALHPQRRASHVSDVDLNQFSKLCLDGEVAGTDATDDDASIESCTECIEQRTPGCPGNNSSIFLADDDLGDRFQVAIILQQVCHHVKAVKEIWSQSSREGVNFTVAAFATNVNFAAVMKLESELREANEKIDISTIAEMCCSSSGNVCASTATNSDSHDLVRALQVAEAAFKHYIHGHNPIKVVSCSTCMQCPADYIQSPPTHDQNGEPRLNSALVDNIMHLIATKQPPSNIVRNSSPVYADLGYILAHSAEGPNTTRLTLGLHLLLESYQSYMLNHANSSSASKPRLTALRLAQQAARSVDCIIDDKACFPCRCPQTLAYHLQNLQQDLTAYSKQRCWDLYFQSPWVAGNHILEMLDLCHSYGQKLFAYRRYVGAVLHSYNVLHQLVGLERIQLLEGLCGTFEALFFPGGRPKSNFRACWTRYIGARPKFKQGHRSRNQRDSWCMAIPAHAARRAAGLGVGVEARDDRNKCLMLKVKQQNYDVSEVQWEAISRDVAPRSRLEALVFGIEEALFPKDANTFPAARLNHFAVFETCAKIIASLSDASHTDPKERGLKCICFVSAILDGADRIVNARKLGKVAGAAWTKSEREGVLDLAMKAVKQDLGVGEEGMQKWFWEI